MRALPPTLRRQLETSVLAARRAAEGASRAAIESLGVFLDRRPEHLDANQATLRNGLRAKWRQLGNDRELLVAECAYEQWHRLLFARFLAENELLLHPQFRAPVSLTECEELAAQLGEPDAWSVAARFAAEILPGIFRLDDPCVLLRLAPEGRYALEEALEAISSETFKADDALGWVYQFWQKDKKDEVNASERKIAGADLGPVTQLFTENYMVRFLLENTLGAWWSARHPDSPLLKDFEYLRFHEEGKPAVGSFEGWPERVAEVTVMDPCCGSGHFLVEAFAMLWRMRLEEEGLSPVEAQDAVLRGNLFGLELDPRCVQIAMFNIALEAWKAGGGWRQLPVPNIACSGVPVKASVGEWKALAQGDKRVESALGRLHGLFRDADTLGSLLDVRRSTERSDPADDQLSLDALAWDEIEPTFAAAARREASDPAGAVLGHDAAGMARAADLLSRQYWIVATNVPFLQRQKQSEVLAQFLDRFHPSAKADLASAMLERASSAAHRNGVVAAVSPTTWLFLSPYKAFRHSLLTSGKLRLLARLGPGAFTAISGEVVKPVLLISGAGHLHNDLLLIDGQEAREPSGYADVLERGPIRASSSSGQVRNPDHVIMFGGSGGGAALLSAHAQAFLGICTGDNPRFVRKFWEVVPSTAWARLVGTVSETKPWSGRDEVLLWESGHGELLNFVRGRLGHGQEGRWIRGQGAWSQPGVALSRAGNFPGVLYQGELFLDSVSTIVPESPADVAALWHFVQSADYRRAVRDLNQKVIVTVSTMVKVPFDLDRWRQVAEAAGPLPEPSSEDPTQWLFRGRVETSTAPLHAAVARLVGYRWPEQAETGSADAISDSDGIACLPAVAGELRADDRLWRLLSLAFGESWSPAKLKELMEQAGTKKKSLGDWLRDDFFKQHCALFGNRPFVWHVWDGQLDGFSALINYHRLDRKTLEKLTYTYLGQDWVERQRAEVRDGVAGAEARLGAALALQRKLEAILEGEPPLDIYVRWKGAHEQAMGWEPDLNDGVRLNIRPFVEAGVLRAPFNIHWRKDRGKNPDGSERLNDVHHTLAEKREARRRAGRG